MWKAVCGHTHGFRAMNQNVKKKLPGWTRLWATWSSCRCPCLLQGSWTRWSLRSLPTQMILWNSWLRRWWGTGTGCPEKRWVPPSLEAFKARLDEALGSRSWWVAALPTAGSWKWISFEDPSNLNHSVILWSNKQLTSVSEDTSKCAALKYSSDV